MKKRISHKATDPDNPEWTPQTSARAVTFDRLPETLQGKLRGRPRSPTAKVAVKLRLDPDLLAALRATGAGWQTRVNAALRERFTPS